MLELELIQRGPLAVAVERGRQLLREGEIGAGMPLAATASTDPAASRRSNAYSRIGSSIEKRGSPRTSPLRTRLWSTSDARPSSTSTPRSSLGPATASARARSKPPMNTANALEQATVGRVQQLVAPHDRAAQRSLALRDVGRPHARLVEPAFEPLVDRRRREEPDPRRGQLDGERHAPEVGDDRSDVARVGVGDREARLDRAPARDESRTDSKPARASGWCERIAAGSCSRSSGPRRSRSGGVGSPGTGYSCSPEIRSGARLVASIRIRPARRSSSPRSAPAPRTCSRLSITRRACFVASSVASASIGLRDGVFADPHRAGDRRNDEVRIGDVPQRHEPGPVRVVVGDACGDLEREARLAGAARPRQGDQPRARQQGPNLVELALPSDERTSAPSAGCWVGHRATGSAGSPRAGHRPRAA